MSDKNTYNPPATTLMEQALDASTDAALESAPGEFLVNLLNYNEKADNNPSFRDYTERYKYLGQLGEGGQGIVIGARDVLLERDVAIKILKKPSTQHKERLLENEAKLGGMLEHPNILPTYDLCRDETDTPFFVMKKVEGVSLEELLRKAHAEGDAIKSDRDVGEYSRRRLINVFLQVCHAIEYAHSRGVYHLDLKPQNVKLGAFGEVYVLDWGFAIKKEDKPRVVAGTPLYIAPERFKPGRPDARCDIYSLGVMLYRILVNHLPRNVGKVSFKEFRENIDKYPLIPPIERDNSLPKDLDAIVMKAMAENPEERYKEVKDLANDLERFLDILPVSAYREGWRGRVKKFVRRHKIPVMAACVMIIAAMATGFAALRAKKMQDLTSMALQRENEERAAKEKAALELIVAEENRMDAIKRRAKARVPLEKGNAIIEKARAYIEREKDITKKRQILKPAIEMFSDAIAILENNKVNNPDSAEAHYVRGRAYHLAKDFSQAKADYIEAYSRDPSFIMAHYYLGRIFYDIDRNSEKAINEFKIMHAYDEKNEFSELGQAYIDAHDRNDAKALERCNIIEKSNQLKSIEKGDNYFLRPDLDEIWYIRGLVYGRKGGEFYDPVKGIEAYENFSERQYDVPSAHLNRGDLRIDLYTKLAQNNPELAEVELDKAIEDYNKALNINPEYKWALKNRGYVYMKYKNQLDKAIDDINKALEIDPAYVAALFDRAAIKEVQGDYKAAFEDYKLIQKIQPENPNIDYRIAILYLLQEKLPEAETALDMSITRAISESDRAVRLHRRGITKFLRGRYKQAVKDFDESMLLRKDGKVYPALMRFITLGRLNEKVPAATFGKQIDVSPDKPWLSIIASIYLDESKLSEAEITAKNLAKTPEAKCEVDFYLGAYYWLTSNNYKALEKFNEAVKSQSTPSMEYIMAKILAKRLKKQMENAKILPDQVGEDIFENLEVMPVPGIPPTIPSLNDLVTTEI